MSTETRLQEFVHRLEHGKWSGIVKAALLIVAVSCVSYLWLLNDSGFKGLSHEKAIEQAQISRELARGNGFSTKVIRPAAMAQFENNKGQFPSGIIPDTYHAPLNPWINSWFLRITRDNWKMTPSNVVYVNDRLLASVQLAFFLLSVVVNYFTVKRLFDHRLAVFVVGLLLLCETLWEFSMSGLPQMLMLLLFSGTAYFVVRAIQAKQAGEPTLIWNAAAGALLGLLALTHSLTLALLAGTLVFALAFFRPFGRDAAVILAVCALLYSPWLIRNYMVCGNPVGVAWHSNLAGICGAESTVMRATSLDSLLPEVAPKNFLRKFRLELMDQLSGIYGYFGSILVAPLFFIAMLHIFRREDTSAFRWWILSTWLAAVAGMCIAGLNFDETPVTLPTKANDLHVLFIPLVTAYGLAFVLVLWSRLEINLRVARIGFLSLIFLVSAIPFISQAIDLLKLPKSRVLWPPYVPPYIAILNQWTKENEVIASDMPWAVAWYADRKSLWLPSTIDEFISINDYNRLGTPIVGLYLTPISGEKPFVSNICKGEYKAWSPFITRQLTQNAFRQFPLHAVTPLPFDNECVFYADHDRWSAKQE